MAKIGRNDQCPCGSGKKHKHCCYGKEVRSFVSEDAWKQDPEWYKIRLTESEVMQAILDFAREKYGEEFLLPAFAEFGIWGERSPDENLLESVFPYWVVFNWTPEPEDHELLISGEREQPLGIDFLVENGSQLDLYQRTFILTACAQPFSFFAVTGVVAGKSLALRDIFLERSFTVKEAQASKTLRLGDIIFARVLALEGQTIILGMGPIGIPPREHTRLLEIRDEIKQDMRDEGLELNLESLLEWDLEMRDIYLGVVEYLANPLRPKLQNTDGDPISFVKLYFELKCSPQEAFDALRSLALDQSPEDILDGATRDENGNLLEVSFDWLKKGNKQHESWENTIMGNLEITGNTLTAEVNSEKRAKKIQTEVTRRLGKRATFSRAEHESLEARLLEMEAQLGTQTFEEIQREQEEFASRPEVQELMEQQMKAHWQGWYNQRIPVLQNKTPLEAARTKDGRERLEALLIEFERGNEEVSQPYLRVDIEAMRKKLGL